MLVLGSWNPVKINLGQGSVDQSVSPSAKLLGAPGGARGRVEPEEAGKEKERGENPGGQGRGLAC